MSTACNEQQIRLVISSTKDEIVQRLNDTISPDVFREAEIIQNKHDISARNELARPFTI
jgi:hypothetical protein